MSNCKTITFERISWSEFLARRKKEEAQKARFIGAPREVAEELAEDWFGGNEEVTQVGYYASDWTFDAIEPLP